MTQREGDRARAVLVTAACWFTAATLALVCSPALLATGPTWPVTGMVGCAAVAAVFEVRQGTPWAAGFRAACWLATATFVGWVATAGWSRIAFAVWLFGGAPFGLAAAISPRTLGGAFAGPGQNSDTSGTSTETTNANLAALISEATGIKQVQVSSVTLWPDASAGHDIAIRIGGSGGQGYLDVKRRELEIGNALDLPTGCGVETRSGPTKRQLILGVSTRDMLAVTRPYVEHLGTSPLSINGPLPLGWRRNGSLVETCLRIECAAVAGKRGGGKTNCLHTITADLARCPDALIWHLNLAGIGMSKPWIEGWLAGQVSQPVVDWVATDVETARLMVAAGIAIIEERQRAYSQMMYEENADILPCSPEIPAVIIIADEIAKATGVAADSVVQAGIIEIIQTGRAWGVQVEVSALRFTSTVLPTDIQSQIGPRLMFSVADESEVGYMLGWKARLDLADAAHPGCGWWVAHPGAHIEVMRTPHVLPRTIAHIAAACADRRPALDAHSAAPLGEQYTDRWSRTMEALSRAPGASAQPVPPAPRTAHRAPAGDLAGIDFAGLREAVRAAEQAILPDAAVKAEFDRIIGDEAGDLEGLVLRGAAADASPRARMLALLEAAGPAGLSGPEVAKRLAEGGGGPSEATLYRWLREDARDGGYGRWLHPKYRSEA